MEITDIRIKKVQGENKLRAYASVTFDNCFVIHNIKVIQGNNGPFIAMPSRKTKNGELKDIAHPINSQFREKMQNAILEAYQSE
ncbi:MAG: septation regulator SpoVG [Brevinematia bacterium]